MITSPKESPAAPRRPRISVGIGSWSDPEYIGVLFPKGVKSEERLKIYATFFDHVELNSSYHSMPRLSWIDSWLKQTPAGFFFDFKLHKKFSEDPENSAGDESLVEHLLKTAQPLLDAQKLGTFFIVMPPSFGPKKNRLEEIDALIEKLRPHMLAVELRDRRWIEGEQREKTFDYFRARKLVWIAVDMPRIEGSIIMPPIDEVTNPRLAYLRLHGRKKDWLKVKSSEERHTYLYPEDELNEIATRVRALAEKADEVHVVANNHAQDFAPRTALALQRLLGLERKRPVIEDDLPPGF